MWSKNPKQMNTKKSTRKKLLKTKAEENETKSKITRGKKSTKPEVYYLTRQLIDRLIKKRRYELLVLELKNGIFLQS